MAGRKEIRNPRAEGRKKAEARIPKSSLKDCARQSLRPSASRSSFFTLRGISVVELIGVLAILAILTALLLPRLTRPDSSKPDVLQTVNEAHILQASLAIQSLDTAVAAHLAQFGTLSSLNGTPLNFPATYDNFSQVLLNEGLIERPFYVSLGTNAFLRLVRTSGLTFSSPVDGSTGAYDLDGGGRNDVVGASFLLEVVIPAVTESEARAMNDRLDGPRLAAPSGQDDWLGRLIYRKPGPNGLTELHIHLQHK